MVVKTYDQNLFGKYSKYKLIVTIFIHVLANRVTKSLTKIKWHTVFITLKSDMVRNNLIYLGGYKHI